MSTNSNLNQYQQSYITLNSQYKAYEQSQQWEQLESIEDELLEAESALINWAISQINITDPTAAETLRNNWTVNPDKVINLALHLH